jgi:hypothetical protein
MRLTSKLVPRQTLTPALRQAQGERWVGIPLNPLPPFVVSRVFPAEARKGAETKQRIPHIPFALSLSKPVLSKVEGGLRQAQAERWFLGAVSREPVEPPPRA